MALRRRRVAWSECASLNSRAETRSASASRNAFAPACSARHVFVGTCVRTYFSARTPQRADRTPRSEQVQQASAAGDQHALVWHIVNPLMIGPITVESPAKALLTWASSAFATKMMSLS